MKVAGGEQAARFQENEDLYKRMNKSLESKIKSKEEEIKNLDVVYDKKIAGAKLEGEREYAQSLDRNQLRIMDETNSTMDKIQGFRDQLQKMHDTVEKEELNVKTSHKDRITSLKNEMESSFQEDYSRLQSDRMDSQSGTQETIKKIAADTKAEKLNLQDQAKFEINALSSEYNDKELSSDRAFRARLDQEIRLHNAEISEKKNEFKKTMDVDTEKNKRLSAEKNRVSQDQLTYQEKHQQEMLTQRDKDFKARYEKLVQEHNTILKDLSDKLDSDMKKIVDKSSNDKKVLEEKVNDPFYNVSILNPKIEEDEKTITVSMPVAQYEKENVHLSTQGRLIKVTLSRKYSDSLTSEDKSLNRSTKSELYSKEFNTKDLLNPQGITQNYTDGVLSFKVKKA